ncbi:MAG: L-histidine N(alpha)-methyltransferase [Pseudomonadota bacterium]
MKKYQSLKTDSRYGEQANDDLEEDDSVASIATGKAGHGLISKYLLQDLSPSTAEFRGSVIAGLSMPHKKLPCKFFYDEEGSQLFNQITEQPEYYLTRTECSILEQHKAEIADSIGSQAALVEFGAGAGIKIRLLLNALKQPQTYIPIDISREHLIATATDLARDFPDLNVVPVCADYTKPFKLPKISVAVPEVHAGFFPGSTIGNFAPVEASIFLTRTRRLLGSGAVMIIGVDLPKDTGILNAAYNDAAGITAAFNLNLLRRINRELGEVFDVSQFAHRAIWNSWLGRIEMHLVSQSAQTVDVGNQTFYFAAGETIHTENSYKYNVEQFERLANGAGYIPLAVWTDKKQFFSVHALRAI